MNNDKRSKAGRFKEKVIHVTAWISAILISLGFIFRSFEWLGGSIIYLLGTLLFALFFAPLYFFTPRKFSNPFVPWWINALAGITFIPLLLATIFKLQQYPYADVLYIIGNIGLGILIAAFIFSSYKIRIKRPVYMGLLSGIIFLSAYQFTEEITSSIDPKQVYLKHLKQVNALNLELSGKVKTISNENRFWIEHIRSIEAEMIDQIPGAKKQFINGSEDALTIAAIESYNYDYLNIPYPSWNPRWGRNYESLEKKIKVLHHNFLPLAKAKDEHFHLSILERDTLSEQEYLYRFFFQQDQGATLIHLEFFKVLMYLNELDTQETISPYFIAVIKNKHTSFESDIILIEKQRQTEREFYGMFFICIFVGITFFFIPTLPLSDAWKTRFILLSLVILFEFVLLVVDQLLGMNSNNLYLILGANILLAIGLVWIDGFVRKNFLAWYKD